MITPVDYVLKFHSDFYKTITSSCKSSTIRDESKPLNTGDVCFATFPPSKEVLLLKITKHYALKFRDLTNAHANNEGYLHESLLKHELKNIYPNLKDDDYVYVYEFQLYMKDVEAGRLIHEFKEDNNL